MSELQPSVRVSILVPTYNNGVESSADGQRNLIGDLMQSLWDTLKDDPTPFELIVWDDGSTDDGIRTLRSWAEKTWPDGRPFMDLIEAEHCGVLSVTANQLSRRARGDILARLDGDVICLTPNWVSKLAKTFDDGPPNLGVIGPKQLDVNFRVHAFGDWVIHPNGYTHIGCGLDRDAIRVPMEVDHVMGCFYCCRKQVFDEVGGYDERYLRGQTIDFGLAARMKGWRCFAVPHIEFIHAYDQRKSRTTSADSKTGLEQSLDHFRDKWGFDRIVPDMDVVRERYRGTPLLWNPRWFGIPEGLDPDDPGPANHSPMTMEWSRFADDERYRSARAVQAGQIVEQLNGLPEKPDRVVHVGARTGLLCHLLSAAGFHCLGVERRLDNIEFGRAATKQQTYTARPPMFRIQKDRNVLPLKDGEVQFLVILEDFQQHTNPIALLREMKRVVGIGSHVYIHCICGVPGEDGPFDLYHPLRHPHQWMNLLNAVGGFEFQSQTLRLGGNEPTRILLERVPEEGNE